MFLFKQPKKIRKRGSMPPDEVKDALDRFLDGEQTQELVRFLVRYWKDQQTVLTFKEIREAILAGAVTAQMMKDWQQDYSKMVAEKFEPEWTAAMEKGALNEMAHKGLDIGFKFRKDHWAVRDWLKDRTAMLVTNSTNEQKEAIRNIIAEGIDKKMTVKELEKFIRPCIGLTKPQAAANLKYYQNIKRQLREKHPRMTDASIEKKASEASMKYADKQLRQRAYTIAHTERAMAYEYGRYQHTKDLIEEGYLPMQQKVWSAAGNESTCERCRYLNGQAVPMDGYFTEANGNQVFLPTLHPRCRCCARYEDAKDYGLRMNREAIVNESRFSDHFQNYNNGQKDTITHKKLLNNLNKSAIGKETVKYINNHPELSINMLYKVDNPNNLYGMQECDDIYIFASETKTIQKTAEILIHEITHHRYNIGNSQWAECVCMAQEVKHRLGKDVLTPDELKSIIKSVKKLYPEYPWR